MLSQTSAQDMIWELEILDVPGVVVESTSPFELFPFDEDPGISSKSSTGGKSSGSNFTIARNFSACKAQSTRGSSQCVAPRKMPACLAPSQCESKSGSTKSACEALIKANLIP